VSTTAEATGATATIAIEAEFGWRCHRAPGVTLWLKGWIDRLAAPELAARLASAAPSPDRLGTLLRETNGHFAIAAVGNGWALAAVDWVRSIPLAAARVDGEWVVDDQPNSLRKRMGLGAGAIDPDAALALGMAGYTIDTASLYRGLEVLGPGEMMVFDAAHASRHRYFTYRPWRVCSIDAAAAERALAETTLGVMERTLASLGGRTLVVPLSAGLDSRLIASAARHLGYKNVHCYAYGRAGNFEAEASRAIAEKLGYPWRFVPTTISTQRKFFARETYRRYLDFADSCASVPFVQDMAPLEALKAEGFVPDDAVLANGNSGDYISGLHIVPALRQPPPATLSAEERWIRITDALYDKHFALWRALRNPARRERITRLLRASIERAGGALGDPAADHGLYEYAEFQDRQCKYVIAGQRIYEFLGHEWRLPLWENAYLRFWEGTPLSLKANQALYVRTLQNADWGGVWSRIPVNRKTIRPNWIRPLRAAVKALHAPFGAERWHRTERRFFQYWMDPTCNTASVPYQTAMCDRRGARHAIAWLTEQYLARHGLDWSGAVVAA